MSTNLINPILVIWVQILYLTLQEAASEMHPECLFQANHKKVQKRNFSFKAPLPLVGLKLIFEDL